MRRQLKEKQEELRQLHEKHAALHARWSALQELNARQTIEDSLQQLVENDYTRRAATIQHKLIRCNGGFIRILKRRGQTYINLTEYQPTPEEDEFLQLGLNCHVAEKPKEMDKRIEVEALLESIFTLEDRGSVTTTDDCDRALAKT